MSGHLRENATREVMEDDLFEATVMRVDDDYMRTCRQH